jgi:hypothetical protein
MRRGRRGRAIVVVMDEGPESAGRWRGRVAPALGTDKWVEAVGPIGDDPAVQRAFGDWITTRHMRAIDPEAFLESTSRERGPALAAHLTNALSGFASDQVDAFLASDRFGRLWVDVNRRAHARVVDVLTGDTGSLQAEDGEVVMILVPVVNAGPARIGEASPEVLGRSVELPTVTVDDIPEESVAKVEAALGRDLPDRFGQIALTRGVSPRGQRTPLQLAFGIALGVVIVRRVGLRLEDDAFGAVDARRSDEATVAWLVAHRGMLRLGGIVTGIVLLLLVDLSWLGPALLVLVVGGFELPVTSAALPATAPAAPEPRAVERSRS